MLINRLCLTIYAQLCILNFFMHDDHLKHSKQFQLFGIIQINIRLCLSFKIWAIYIGIRLVDKL